MQSHPSERSGSFAFLAGITLFWLAARLFPLLQAVPWTFWEVWEARKLLEYGFLNQLGGIVEIHHMTGRLTHPEAFYYTHHPYPILWLFTLVYQITGPWGVVLFNSAWGLVGSLLLFKVLCRYFDAKNSFLATVCATLAPSSIFFDIDPSIVACSAIVWPFILWTLPRPAAAVSKSSLWIPGFIIFIAGQICWFSLTILPALWMLMPGNRDIKNKWWQSVLWGATATACLFVTQVIFYTSDYGSLFGYAAGQSALLKGDQSRWSMLPNTFVKSFVMMGPALVFGSFLAFAQRQALLRDRIMAGTALYFGIFLLTGLVLTRFFFRERTMYEFLVVPAAFMTAFGLQNSRRWVATSLSLGLAAILGIIFVHLQAAIPRVSETSKVVGSFLASSTNVKEVILTNLKEQQWPFAPWDVGSRNYTAMIADRLLFFDVQSPDEIEKHWRQSAMKDAPAVYILDLSKSPESTLATELQTHWKLRANETLELPKEPLSMTTRLRTYYWKLIGSAHSADSKSSSYSRTLKVAIYDSLPRGI